ncbi:MAG: OsmC family protein [Gammaproteobacteria bacterium]|nr:OsmC family protein [Gammaproteobacteria bacterium]
MQKRVNFNNRENHLLSGILNLPDTRDVVAYALFAHCFTCTKSIKAASHIAGTLARQGIATLRFDFTGLGGSKGDFTESNFSTNISDLIDAAEFLKAEYLAPQILVGHSLGGTAILAASQHIESARAVATIGSPANPEHILHLLQEHLAALQTSGEAEVMLAGRPFNFKQDFVDDALAHQIDYQALNKALMVMHSPIDDTVSIAEASKIFTAALHPKSFVSLDNADHLLSGEEDSRYVGEVLASWVRPYLQLAENELTGEANGVYVEAKTAEGFLCKINANGHRMVADEPANVGGSNLGPTPYEYLATALGSCTAMTMNMYARHKKLNLSSVTVQVDHDRIHAEDCADCEKKSGQVDILSRTISVDGNLNDAQRTRLLEIADRCPVHKTLENEIKITTKSG